MPGSCRLFKLLLLISNIIISWCCQCYWYKNKVLSYTVFMVIISCVSHCKSYNTRCIYKRGRVNWRCKIDKINLLPKQHFCFYIRTTRSVVWLREENISVLKLFFVYIQEHRRTYYLLVNLKHTIIVKSKNINLARNINYEWHSWWPIILFTFQTVLPNLICIVSELRRF